jgi:rod shape determining protein RodA
MRQAAFFAIGTVLAIVLSRVDYSRLRELKYALRADDERDPARRGFGGVTRGSRRAIQLPFFESMRRSSGKDPARRGPGGVRGRSRARPRRARLDGAARARGGGPPAIFVMASDLGSGLVYIAILFAALFGRGREAGGTSAGLITLGRRLDRARADGGAGRRRDGADGRAVLAADLLLSPADVAGDAGYQQNQSRIAIGSGQKTGRGELATQRR